MLKFALYSVIITVVSAQRCPETELLKPCVCDSEGISCGGTEIYDLRKIFLNLNQALKLNETSFDSFYFNNTAIKSIEANTFYNITFRKIIFFKAESLEKIHTNAFNSCIHTLEEFDYNNDVNDDTIKDNLINDPPNYNIFEMLSSFINVEKIVFLNKLITSIPDNAFQTTNGLQNLNILFLGYRYTLTTIGKNSFSNLNNLTMLYLGYSKITHIASESFWFRNTSDTKLYIYLHYNALNGSSFESGAFLNTKRPTYVHLRNNNITYLDEKIFEPLLALNSDNRINVFNNPIDCKDCRNKWIFDDKINLEKKIEGAYCNGEGLHTIFEKASHDFEHCKSVKF